VPFELSVALRYLAASRRRAHVAVISAISIGGLAVGVAALVVSIALLTGFQDKIRERLARVTPHLLIEPVRASEFPDPGAVERAVLADPRVVSAEEVASGRGWVAGPEERSVLPVAYRGAEGGGLEPGEAAVSSTVAGQLGVGRGSRISLTGSRMELSPLGPIPVTVELRVARIEDPAAMADESAGVRISMEDARVLAGSPGAASALEVRLRSAGAADAVAADLLARLPGRIRVRTWRRLNVGLNFALRMEKVLIFVTVFLIVLVACLNVLSDLSLLVVEKRRDLGILATLGAPARSLGRVYWWLGGTIGGIGTLAGLLAGAGISWALDRYALVPLPRGVYLMSHVPFALHARDLAFVVAFSLLTVLLSALLPARAAARLGPAEALTLSR